MRYAADKMEELEQQRDRLAEELNESEEEYGLWWAQKRIAIDERDEAREQRDRLAEALVNIKNELGVPQPEYPAPVANAVKIADEALQSLTNPNEL